MTDKDIFQLVQEVNPYAFLNEVSEEIPPPENTENPEEWLSQFENLLAAHDKFENPALSVMEEITAFEEEFSKEGDSTKEAMQREAQLFGLSASIAQTEYWFASLCAEKLEGYIEASPAEEHEPDEIIEAKKQMDEITYKYSFLMWRNGLSHLMYMNYEPFLRESGFNYLDYHDKIHVSFVILTASTLVETSLNRVLVDIGVEVSPRENLHNLINMTWSNTGMNDSDKETLHNLRKARNLVAHDISQRTDYQGWEEVEDFNNHFDATFGVTVRALNTVSRLLNKTHDLNDPYEEFHQTSEEMIDFVISQ